MPLTITKMSYKRIIAVDHAWHGDSFAVLENGQVLKPVAISRFTLSKAGLARLQKNYQPDLLLLTGPGTAFLPDQSNALKIKKENRLQALLDGVHFLTPSAPSLTIVFETGCHLFYRSEETVYVGCLPYSYGSNTLKKALPIAEEMGHEVGKPLDVCLTAALPDFPHIKSEEMLLHYTTALALKEFLVRYKLNSCYIGGTVSSEVREQLQQFLPGITMKMLDNSSHIAAFGLLLPYIQPEE